VQGQSEQARTPVLGLHGSSLGKTADLKDGGLRYACYACFCSDLSRANKAEY
jgi:hypothetical protein